MLELLVSLALLGLIAAGLAGAFGLGLQVFDRAQRLETTWPEIAARRQLRAYLLQAAPANRTTSFPTSFVGTPAKLEFVTLADAPFAPNSAALAIALKQQNNALILQVTVLDDSGLARETSTHPVSRDVRNVQIRYLTRDNDELVWVTDWQSEMGLPALIDVTAQGGTPPWVRFTVAPRLQ